VIETKPNILLITIDCARQDMIYGDEVETPHIDKLREEGITFTNAFSQSSSTIPSLYSLFTSKYLSTHGVINQNPAKYKRIGNDSLPVILARNGWSVEMFSGLDILERVMLSDIKNCITGKGDFPFIVKKEKQKKKFRRFLENRARALNHVIPSFIKAHYARTLIMSAKTNAETLVDNASAWLSRLNEDNFFLWIHFFDAHLLYWAPDKWLRRYYKKPTSLRNKTAYEQAKAKGLWFPEVSLGSILKRTKDMNIFPATYKAALSYIDEQIGRLVIFLRDIKKYEDTLIVLTADHGENLLENGIFCGHNKLFDATTKIPFFVRDPNGFQPKEVPALVQHIDLLPTLLERLKINLPREIDGKSLWPCINSKEEVNEFVFSEHTNMFQKTIRNKAWQYLWANTDKKPLLGPEFEGGILLDRHKGDNKNYASRYPAICKEMEAMIHKLSGGFQPADEKEGEVPQEMIEKLKALGYLDL
jgi:arylsulfatase